MNTGDMENQQRSVPCINGRNPNNAYPSSYGNAKAGKSIRGNAAGLQKSLISTI